MLALCAAKAAAGELVNAPGDRGNLVHEVAVNVSLGFERVELPGGERMGLLGASYTAELSPGWWLGPALYGAATGRRGGLFTWGVEGQRRWRLGGPWHVIAGAYVGGGGGAAAPVGGGLMLRPHADLMRDLGGWAGGLTVSQVRFSNGAIRSTQLGVLVSVTDRFSFVTPGQHGSTVRFAGTGGGGGRSVAGERGSLCLGLGPRQLGLRGRRA